jgi:mono/diheme cytochrome c family protein
VLLLVSTVPCAAVEIPADFPHTLRPLLTKYCVACHGPETETRFQVAALDDSARRTGDLRLVEQIATLLETGKMPPEGETQPTGAERKQLAAGLRTGLRRDPALAAQANPGHVVLRRLNRYEYANTVRDLFLMSTPVWKYSPPPGAPMPEKGIEYSRRTYNLPYNLPPDEVDYGFDNIGEVLTLSPYLLESYFEVAGLVVDRVAADTVPDKTVAPSAGNAARRPKVLPIRPSAMLTEEQAARGNLATLASRAFRRPATEPEVEKLVDLFRLARANEPTFDAAMKIPLRALLVAPDFLYHVERTPSADRAHADDGAKPAEKSAEPGSLDRYALASRLSFFLWASMPDAELFEAARTGRLADSEEIERQVRRMLRDPKAESLAEHFAPQWLQIEEIQAAMPDPVLYAPFYQRFLGGAMRTEAIMLFDSVVTRDRNILDLVTADTTFTNDVLARYYGLPFVATKKYESFALWKERPLPAGRRAGVLSLGAVAVMTSTPTRSSPVKRGKWVLETVLGDPPAPPPPNVEVIEEKTSAGDPATFRQKLERHRTATACAACHASMDPLGFALENLDAVGRWRATDGDRPVDAAGTLKNGATITGPEGLRDEILEKRPDEFARALAEHLLTFALGRKREWYDQAAVEQIVRALREDEYRFSRLAIEIAKSRPFCYAK